MAHYKPIEEQLAVKIQNNRTCPCKSGKKYKKCCKGKQLFFPNEKAKQEAEWHILQREEKVKAEQKKAERKSKLNAAN